MLKKVQKILSTYRVRISKCWLAIGVEDQKYEIKSATINAFSFKFFNINYLKKRWLPIYTDFSDWKNTSVAAYVYLFFCRLKLDS